MSIFNVGIFHGIIFCGDFPGETLHWVDLTEILYDILFFLLSFCQLIFESGDVPGNSPGAISARLDF